MLANLPATEIPSERLCLGNRLRYTSLLCTRACMVCTKRSGTPWRLGRLYILHNTSEHGYVVDYCDIHYRIEAYLRFETTELGTTQYIEVSL